MKRLIISALALALSSPTYADEEDSYYSCWGTDFPCEKLKKGDLLYRMEAEEAALYCDANKPIVEMEELKVRGKIYACSYNGKPYKNVWFTKNRPSR